MGGIPKTRVRFRVRPKYFTIVKHTQSPQIDENFQQKNRKFSKKISKFRNFPNFFIATPNGPSYKLFGTVRQFFLNTKGSPFEIFRHCETKKIKNLEKKSKYFNFFCFTGPKKIHRVTLFFCLRNRLKTRDSPGVEPTIFGVKSENSTGCAKST